MTEGIEVWRPVVGFEGLYEVSNLGRVRSLCYHHGNRRKAPKILKPYKDRGGYLLVNLCKDGNHTPKKVHRILAEAFLPNPSNLPQINHKNEDKTSNAVFLDENGNAVSEKSNLEWCDAKYNSNYGTRLERLANAQLNDPKRSKKVLQHDPEGNLVQEYPSVHEIERQTGWDRRHILNCCHGKTKTSHGFVWRFAQ